MVLKINANLMENRFQIKEINTKEGVQFRLKEINVPFTKKQNLLRHRIKVKCIS